MRVWVTPGNAQTGSALAEVAARTGLDLRMLESVPDRIANIDIGPLDLFVHWSMEYHPVPLDLHTAPCRTVGVLGDWNLGGRAVQSVGGAFDMLVADRNGVDRLRQLGFEHVMYAPLWCYDPVRHRPLPNVERDIDILMVGSFNHNVQRERGRLLWRVAQLSRKHRVVLTTGVYGDDYTKLLNRARIVFNRSVRGEINMRVYESAACGALPFYERGNAEIGGLLTHGSSCVLYGDDDLEHMLEEWLSDEPRRASAARSAQEAVQGQTLASVLERVIVGADARLSMPRKREWSTYSDGLVTVRHATHRVGLANGVALPGAERLAADSQHCAETAQVASGVRSVAVAEVVRRISDPNTRNSMAVQSATLFGENPVGLAKLHRGLLMAIAGSEACERDLTEALAELEDCQVQHLCGSGFPAVFDTAWVEMESAYTQFREGTAAWAELVRPILRWQAATALAEWKLQNGDAPAATRWAEMATEIRPDLADAWRVRGRAWAALGDDDAAAVAFGKALVDQPLDPDLWTLRLRALIGSDRRIEAVRFVEDVLAVCAGCPPFYERSTEFRRIRERLIAEPLRLMAEVDWETEESWRPVVTEFAKLYGPTDPVRLILPMAGPESADSCIEMLERYLHTDLGMAEKDVPEIELVESDVHPLWARKAADAAVGPSAMAATAGLPMIELESMDAARTMLRAA